MSTNNRRFLHTLTPAFNRISASPTYQIAGADWVGHEVIDSHDWLSLYPSPGVILEIRRDYQGEGFLWEWSLRLAKGVYARHTAVENSIEAAAAAAIAYAPRVLTFDYLGESTWYETAAGNLFAVIDGESASITKRASGYCWARHWAPAKTLTEAMKGYCGGEIEGTAPTVEAAMIACIEAPARLKAACGALIASLRAASAPAPSARGPLDTCAKHSPAVAPAEAEGGAA